MRDLLGDFWSWYERRHALNIAIAAGLFTLQLVHLVWLTGDPLSGRVFGDPLFDTGGPLRWLVVLVDYTEIPALVSVSLVYVNDLRKQGASLKPILYLVFLNSQFLHIFWITDEFVVSAGSGASSSLPTWLVYIAMLIDYLELPVIYDTLRRVGTTLREEGLGAVLGRRAAGRPPGTRRAASASLRKRDGEARRAASPRVVARAGACGASPGGRATGGGAERRSSGRSLFRLASVRHTLPEL